MALKSASIEVKIGLILAVSTLRIQARISQTLVDTCAINQRIGRVTQITDVGGGILAIFAIGVIASIAYALIS